MSWKVTKIKTCEVDDDNSIDFVCDSDGLTAFYCIAKYTTNDFRILRITPPS